MISPTSDADEKWFGALSFKEMIALTRVALAKARFFTWPDRSTIAPEVDVLIIGRNPVGQLQKHELHPSVLPHFVTLPLPEGGRIICLRPSPVLVLLILGSSI